MEGALERGLALYQAGRAGEALALFEAHLEEHPYDMAGRLALAYALSSVGRHEEAVREARTSAAKEKESPDAAIALALVLLAAGSEEAMEEAARACSLAPDDADYPSRFGLEAARTIHPAAGLPFIREAAKRGRLIFDHRANYALMLEQSGAEVEARVEWGKLAKLWPEQPRVWLALAKLQLAHGLMAQSQASAQRAVSLDPANSSAWLMLAFASAENHQTEAAREAIDRALGIEPNHPLALAARGFWLQEQGDFEEARRSLLRSLELNPTHGFAWYNLVRAKKATGEDEPTLQRLEAMHSDPATPLRDKGYLAYALGKSREDLGENEASWHWYERANEASFQQWLAAKPWDREEYQEGFEAVASCFTRDRLASLTAGGSDSETPIIIVGMIRSGTSLLEQVLSSHPQVAGAGELPYWHEAEADIWQGGEVKEPALRERAAGYLETLREKGGGRPRVTDKLPHNYAMLGYIHAAFPKAKILHMTRSPRDTALSVFTTAFQRPPVFAHVQENIVFAYRAYQRLMDHWRKTLPSDILLEVRYEDMVADKAGESRRILEFCGLEVGAEALDHTQNQRSVRTPSLWQVRQPIYRTSIARWKKFEPWLGALMELEEDYFTASAK